MWLKEYGSARLSSAANNFVDLVLFSYPIIHVSYAITILNPLITYYFIVPSLGNFSGGVANLESMLDLPLKPKRSILSMTLAKIWEISEKGIVYQLLWDLMFTLEGKKL